MGCTFFLFPFVLAWRKQHPTNSGFWSSGHFVFFCVSLIFVVMCILVGLSGSKLELELFVIS